MKYIGRHVTSCSFFLFRQYQFLLMLNPVKALVTDSIASNVNLISNQMVTLMNIYKVNLTKKKVVDKNLCGNLLIQWILSQFPQQTQ